MYSAGPRASRARARPAGATRTHSYLLRQPHPQPLHVHGGGQAHSGPHLQAPSVLSACRAAARLLQLEQGQGVVFFMTASLFLEHARCSSGRRASCPAITLAQRRRFGSRPQFFAALRREDGDAVAELFEQIVHATEASGGVLNLPSLGLAWPGWFGLLCRPISDPSPCAHPASPEGRAERSLVDGFRLIDAGVSS